MAIPWWVWFLFALYIIPGVYCFVALLTMKPIGGLPEEGDEPPRPHPRWLKIIILPIAFVIVIVLWPVELYAELRR